MEENIDTEKKILEAAREVFSEKGYDGARMQEIADKAKINKAMLHYYFRSKERLFEHIFIDAFQEFWPKVEMLMAQSKNVRELIKGVIGNYIDMFISKPYLPIFVLSEINRNPDRLQLLLKNGGVKPDMLLEYIQKQMDCGNIKKMNPGELLINIISLSVFPFAGRPLFERFTFKGNKDSFDTFIKSRKQTLFDFLELLIIS